LEADSARSSPAIPEEGSAIMDMSVEYSGYESEKIFLKAGIVFQATK